MLQERFGVKGNDRLETTQDHLTTLNNLGTKKQ